MDDHIVSLPLVAAGAPALDLALTPEQSRRLGALTGELLRWTPRVNLTAIKQLDDVQIKHILDSLSIAPILHRLCGHGDTVIDVGSGAGFPGLVLAISLPHLDRKSVV